MGMSSHATDLSVYAKSSSSIRAVRKWNIAECLEIIDVGCNLKQFDDLTDPDLRQCVFACVRTNYTTCLGEVENAAVAAGDAAVAVRLTEGGRVGTECSVDEQLDPVA